MKTQVCRVCERELPLSSYAKNRNTKTGHKYECKECDVIRQRRQRDQDKLDAKVYKICTLCGRRKPLTAFFRDRRRSDGRQAMCKVCRKQEYGEDKFGLRVCKYCGDDLDESASRTGDVCPLCSSKTRGWMHGKIYLCVADPGPRAPFKGGHFTQLEMDEMLSAGYWDEGTVFELWDFSKYQAHYEVVGIQLQHQTLEETEGTPRGDGRFLT